MKNLKVVFFGTPEFARESLKAICESPHQVVGVVTIPDKASGRGQKLKSSPVKEFAVEKQIPVYQPVKLRDPQFLEQMKALNADVFVVVAFRMMPKMLFEIPPLGTFNLHGSLLPDYRGAAPINYAVINGEQVTGVTSFFINERIDEGNILLRAKAPIAETDDAGMVHDKLMLLGARLVVETLNGLAEGNLKEQPQPAVAEPKMAPKIFKEDTLIHWDRPTKTIYDFIRGLSPYPAAYTRLSIQGQEKQLKIFSGTREAAESGHQPGDLEISKDTFRIYTADGAYCPQEVQLEGKRRMAVKDFLNGFHSFEDIHLA